MDSSQGETLTDEKSADDKYSIPPTSITCRHCSRPFAYVSIEHALVPFTHQDVACASCVPFLELYEILRAKESEHTALLDRGPKHNGRREAYIGYRDARIALENFLITVEAPDEASLGDTRADTSKEIDHTQQGHVHVPGVAHEHGKAQQGPGNGLGMGETPSTYSSISPKRKSRHESEGSGPGRKRIRFTETVEELPRYRSSLEYCRSAKEYRPGRYVAAEGAEHWDTSGSTMSFAKFTGQKKMGSRFVDIAPKENLLVGQDKFSESRKNGEANGEQAQNEKFQPELEQTQGRAKRQEMRTHGRSSSTTPSATARPRRKVAQYDGSNDDTLCSPPSNPSLVVSLKYSRAADTTSENGPFRRSSHVNDRHERHGSSALVEASRTPAESAKVRQAISNIQREMVILKEAFVLSPYRDMVSAAIRSFDNLLKPLATLEPSRSDAASESKDDQVQDVCLVQPSDVTDREISTCALCDLAVPEEDEVTRRSLQAAMVIDNAPNAGAEVASKSKARHMKPEQDREDAPGPTTPETSKNGSGSEVVLSTSSAIRAGDIVPKRPKDVESHSEAQLSELEPFQISTEGAIANCLSTQSLEVPKCDMGQERAPSALNAVSSPATDEPSLMEEWYTPPSVRTVRDSQVILSQVPEGSLLPVLSYNEREENRSNDLDHVKERCNQTFRISKHNDRGEIARTANARPEKALRASSLTSNDLGAASDGTGPGAPAQPDHRICLDEPTLAASLKKLPCIEETKSAQQTFDHLAGGQRHKHGLPAHSANYPPEAGPQSSNIGQRLGLAHLVCGEVLEELEEIQATDTDWRELARESQVDPHPAHDPAQEDAPCDRDFTNHRDENTTGNAKGHQEIPLSSPVMDTGQTSSA